MELEKRLILGFRGSRPGDELLERDLDAMAEAGVAGVILFDRDVATGGPRNVESPGQLRDLIAHVRERLGVVVVVSVDQEGGRVARLKAESGFAPLPSAQAIAALPADERRRVLDASCREMASLGVNLNFAPVVDLAVDADGPVIARLGRTYGDDAAVVATLAGEVVAAHVDAGVLPCLKHFPGHGSAAADSHKSLPDVTDAWRRDELEPFRRLVDTPMVMTAHLFHRGLDADRPASLSRRITTDLLRGKLGFRGRIVTDSLDMAGARTLGPLGDVLRMAADAGADLLLHGCNSPLNEWPADVIAAARGA